MHTHTHTHIHWHTNTHTHTLIDWFMWLTQRVCTTYIWERTNKINGTLTSDRSGKTWLSTEYNHKTKQFNNVLHWSVVYPEGAGLCQTEGPTIESVLPANSSHRGWWAIWAKAGEVQPQVLNREERCEQFPSDSREKSHPTSFSPFKLKDTISKDKQTTERSAWQLKETLLCRGRDNSRQLQHAILTHTHISTTYRTHGVVANRLSVQRDRTTEIKVLCNASDQACCRLRARPKPRRPTYNVETGSPYVRVQNNLLLRQGPPKAARGHVSVYIRNV